MKKVTIPFDIELARKIQEGYLEGRIIDREGEKYTILKYDAPGKCPLVCICSSPMTNDLTIVRTYTINGKHHPDKDESPYDLVLEVPEYVTWKEGDYLTVNHDGRVFVIIYKSYDHLVNMNVINYHALCKPDVDLLQLDSNMSDGGDITPSTPEEIQALTDILSYIWKRWNPETKRIEDVNNEPEPEQEFKPFDRILVRDDERDYWRPEFFSYKDEDGNTYCCGGVRYVTSIPYEGNEHLAMTTISNK